jgi:PmbA protein
LIELVQRIVKMALDRGATDAECTLAEGEEFSAAIRMREVESIKDAGSKGIGLRILIGKRTGSSYTSDLTNEGLDRMVTSALELAQVTTEDPFAGLPEPAELGKIDNDLGLFSPDAAALSTEHKIELAKRAEAAAFAVDPRISNSEGASFDSGQGKRAFANSRGFAGCYATSSCSLSVVAVAKEDSSMERDYWYTSARGPAKLEAPEYVGQMAATRALRRLKARKVTTQKAAIVLEPRTARSLLGEIFSAIAGDSVYRKASFLADKLGETVASPNFTVVDDGTIPGLFGSTPFYDEGAPSRRTMVIERGVLKNYLLNTYTAKKLGLKTTGNASRGLTGSSHVGPGNFYLEAGPHSPEEILRAVGTGLYVTEMIGSGVNTVTGDFSQGAVGLWIENGELAYPVSEVTIAGNLKEMLRAITYVGSDLEFRGSIASPTLTIGEMTISGN